MNRIPLLTVALMLSLAPPAAADTVYRWRDAGGGLHFSNRAEITPAHAAVADLPELGRSVRVPVGEERAPAYESTEARDRSGNTCAVMQRSHVAYAMVDAAARAVDRGRRGGRLPAGFTLFVDGEPMLFRDDAVLQHVSGVDADDPSAAVSMASVAYPAGMQPCSGDLSLERYEVAAGRSSPARDLCDDYRRAFAEVGVAVSRDAGVAASFREIAEHFALAAERDGGIREKGSDVPMRLRTGPRWPTTRTSDHEWTAPALAPGLRTGPRWRTTRTVRWKESRPRRGRAEVRGGILPAELSIAEPMEVNLPPWLLDAHAAQTAELAEATEAFVDELTVALEEIDRAARASGCW